MKEENTPCPESEWEKNYYLDLEADTGMTRDQIKKQALRDSIDSLKHKGTGKDWKEVANALFTEKVVNEVC